MNKKLIFGFVGEISSGKGTACQYLADKYDAPSYRFSTMLRDILQRLHMDISRDHMQRLSQVLREEFGQDTLAKVIAQDVNADPNLVVTVDGIRRDADIQYLREIPGFVLVYLTAEQKIRYERITSRGENTDDVKKTFEQFVQDQQAEAEQQIVKTASGADERIDNNGSLQDLQNALDELVKKYRDNEN